MKITKKKNIYMVLGFARSGTSVITRGLHALGVDLGGKIIKHSAKNRWNPTGFFEDEEVIYQINAKIYEKVEHPIRGIPMIPADKFKEDSLLDIKKYAVNMLHQRFSKTNHWGFKNPSSAKIIPFWQSLFAEEKLQAHYIIALRNPLSSASSFAKLTDVDLETGLILWLTHMIPAVDETLDKKSIVISYELMMQDPMKQLLRMKSQLTIHTDKEDFASYTEQFLNDTLHHHRFNETDLRNHSTMKVVPLSLKVYDLLMKVATDELKFQSPEFLVAWKIIKKEFDEHYAIYCYIDTLLKRNKEAQNKIRRTQKSIFWKLIYPLFWVDNYLRDLRVKKRTKNKRIVTAYE